jgi:chemotaxis protein CheD
MEEIIDVNTGEVRTARNKTTLRAMAIGSCIVITGYDRNNKAGAMAHVMLPGSAPEKESRKTKYAADAVDELIKQMPRTGTSDIEVCLVGGGNVLDRENDSVCQVNIDSVSQILKEKDIPVMVCALGGTKRKTVRLDVETGTVMYSEGNGSEKLLWQPSEATAIEGDELRGKENG